MSWRTNFSAAHNQGTTPANMCMLCVHVYHTMIDIGKHDYLIFEETIWTWPFWGIFETTICRSLRQYITACGNMVCIHTVYSCQWNRSTITNLYVTEPQKLASTCCSGLNTMIACGTHVSCKKVTRISCMINVKSIKWYKAACSAFHYSNALHMLEVTVIAHIELLNLWNQTLHSGRDIPVEDGTDA